MNKIYKLVWSKVRNTWVVASEIAKGHGKSSSSEGNGKLLKSLVLTALLGSFMAAGTSPVAAALTPEQQAVYDAVMAQLKASGKVELGGKTGTNTGVAIGSLSEAPNQGTVAIGESAKGEFQSVAIGQDAQARWVDDTPNVSGNNIAIGASTRAYAANGIAQGNYASVYGTRGIAIGLQATVGEKPLTEQEYQEKVASGEISAADKKLYVRSEESNGNFVYRKLDTTGTDITKDHFNGIAIGSLAQSNAADSIALGSGAETYGDSSWATGYKAKAEGDYSMALGVQANSKKRLSVAIGGLANASEANAVAIGAGSQAKTSGGVAIGAASVADRAEGAIGYALGGDNSTIEKAFESAGLKDKYDQLKGITDPLQSEYNGLVRDYQAAARGSSEEAQAKQKLQEFAQQHADFMTAVEEKAKMVAAWKSAAGAVSIGDQENGKTRQLTGLAAGTKDTDAVNVAQLKVLDAKKADKNLNNITEEGQTVIKNLAKGAVVVAAGTNTTVQATEDAETGVKTYTVNVAADGQVTDGNAGIVTGGTVYNAIKDKADKSELTDIKVKYFSVNPEGTDLAKPADDIDNSNNDGAWAIRSMAIGPKARANQDASMAIGYGAETVESGSYGMAIGYEAKSLGQDALAGGYHAMSGNTGVAIGSNAKAAMRVLQKGGKEVYEAYEDAAVAVGNNAYARRSGSIAVGANSVANRWSIAVGQYSHSIGEESTAIGNMSHAYGDSSFAGGKRSGAYGGGSVAIGVQAKVGEAPITEEAFKKLQNAGTAMLADEFDKKRLADELTQEDITKYQGHLYVEQKEGGTTVYRRIEDPSGNMISYMKGVAIGAQTTVEGKQSVAIGAGANAKGKNSVTLGTGSAVDGTYSAAMGYVAKAAGDMSVAMGVQSNTSAKGAVAIGVKANSGGKYGAALGAFAEASALDSTALGSSATATTNGGVALGANTVANVEAGKVGYAFAADGATLEQTIEAAGQKEKYDQLKAVINPLKDEYNGLVQAYQNAPSKSTEETQAKQALNTWIQGHGDFMKAVAEKTKLESTWQSGAGAVAVGNATNGKTRQITGVAAGSEDTDAVNVAQLKALDNKVTDKLKDAGGVHYFSVNSDDKKAPNGTNWNNDGAKGEKSVAIGPGSTTKFRNGLSVGTNNLNEGYDTTVVGSKNKAYGVEHDFEYA